MLTVMHRHNDGTETIYQAEAVVRENCGAASIPATGDVLLRGVPTSDGLLICGGPGSCSEGNGTLRISARFMGDGGFDESRVFVMNKHGATVARHVIFRRPVQAAVTEQAA